MPEFTTRSMPLLVASLSMMLGACGGGGGGGGSAPAAVAPVAISAANAPQVAGTSYTAASGLEGAGSGGVGALTGAVIQTSGPRIDVLGAIVSQVKTVQPSLIDNQVSVVTGAVISQAWQCSNGGSISIALNDLNNDLDLSTGENINMVFSSCNEAGFVMNGSISVNNVVITGDINTPLSAYTMQMTLQANNFTASENGETVGLNGALTLNESTADGISFTSSVSGSSISLTESGVSTTLTNFQINSTEDEGTGAYTLDINATVSNSQMGGSVTIVTDVTFQGNAFEDPSSGEATITGADGTSVRLIALNSVDVRLEVDSDGVPGVDSTIDTTWAAL